MRKAVGGLFVTSVLKSTVLQTTDNTDNRQPQSLSYIPNSVASNPTKMVSQIPSPIPTHQDPLTPPPQPPEQRLLRNKPTHAPPPTGRFLRRLHPPTHLPHEPALSIQYHGHGHNTLQRPDAQHDSDLRQQLVVADHHAVVPARRGHLRAAAVPAAQPRRRG